MGTIFSIIHKYKGLYKNLSRILVILAIGFLASWNASAQGLSPGFTVFPEWEWFDGEGWPDGATVSISVVDKDCDTSVESWGGFFNGGFKEGCDVVVGDVVIFTDGETTRTHTVRNLSINGWDVDADTLSGLADAGTQVIVRTNEQDEVAAIADLNGFWTADFGAAGVDLVENGGGRAWIYDEEGNATAVQWQIPNPHFTVFPEWEWFDGNDWPDGAIVSISVEGKPVCETAGESWGGFFNGGFPEGCDVAVGDEVTFTDGETIRIHTVRDLAITSVDKNTDIVSGTGEIGSVVYTWVHEYGYDMQFEIADGTWLADFGSVGLDLMENMGGRAEIRDEFGNATAVDWWIPNPHFTVFPEWEWFDGMDWPDGATVYISVEGKACDTSVESWGGFFNGGFPEGCDVAVGDIVSFDDGETFRWHEVRDLSISKVDPEDNIVKGIANPWAEVHVWPHATGQEQLAITNPKGQWNVDFTGIYDLMPGDAGRAEIRDEFGNATAVDWYIPQPSFTIYPDAQWFDGNDWPDGAVVTISVKNKPECTFTRDSWGNFFNGGFPEGCEIVARDRVTFTDGAITRKHTVQNLAIIIVDKDAGTVSGFADSGAVIHTWVWNSDGSTLEGSDLEVTAVNGEWLADFGDLGIDLEVGMGIQAEIRDENGNATSVDLPVPDPRMVASLSENWVYLVDFIPGSMLNLAIYENQSSNPDWQVTRIADVNGFVWIDSEGWELDPGDYLIATDGNTTKTLEVEGFTFDVFDLTNGHLEGTAPEPFGRDVWAGFGYEDGGWSQVVTTDETGSWLADFGGPIPNDYWWVWAQIFDEDGDASELRPASQVIFLRSRCGSTYTIQAGSLLEIRYGSWVALGEQLAIDNASHLTVELALNGEIVTNTQKQPVVPIYEIPCTSLIENAYGVFYVAHVGPLSSGTYSAEVTWILDDEVFDGSDWYGPGVVGTNTFTLIVP